VRFSTRGVQKHHRKLFGENPRQKLLAEKVEIFFPLSSFPIDFFIAFLAVSLHEEPQKKSFFSDRRISKNLQKKGR
jgi:hypothetical protein